MEYDDLRAKQEIVDSIRCIRRYCKEHGVFAYNDYMERSFNRSLDDVLKAHREQYLEEKG